MSSTSIHPTEDSKAVNATGVERYLRFMLSGENFAIPLKTIREVSALVETTKTPHTPSYLLGIINLRGQIVTVFDLRTKLGFKAEKGAETAIIICDLNPLCFGVVVDAIDSVMTLKQDEIGPRPDFDKRVNVEYVMGIARSGEDLVLLLDLAKVLGVEDLVARRSAA